jgi:tRNA(Arg) A34 adenosine deaminase TadA
LDSEIILDCLMDYDTNEVHKYMNEAFILAEVALSLGEVPVGCVIVYQHVIIGKGRNRTNETGHVRT